VTPPAPAPAPESWSSSLPDDIRGYVELKGFKDAGTVVSSYRELEKAIGVPKERLLKLPEKPDAPEWNEIYNRLGKPSKAEEYLLQKKEGADPTLAKWAEETFHGANLTRDQADKVMTKWNEMVGKQSAELTAANEAKTKVEVEGLKKEWGMAFDQKMNIADRAAEKYGLDEKDVQAIASTLGRTKVIKLLSEIGSSLGEDSFVTGGSANVVKTPAAAKAELDALKFDDDFGKKLLAGDVATQERLDKLSREAFTG
jgi:hypothetical protein